MFDRIARWQPDRGGGGDPRPRRVGALALAALAVIHVVDLPGHAWARTGLVGIGYLGINRRGGPGSAGC